ncbi:MAG TPA: DUF58 domain-containing protein [Thermoanaerobaculia bacterium]|jgi:uncharacterized protein (DUF58 family)|nr:DUF58 domain-containing protein [Thermoanaerobaculia bacterium]
MRLFRAKPPQIRDPLARRVRDLEILSARMIRAGFAGDYHSAFHGRGIEFSQVREYQPGDDIRTIDWNVTARSGVPHVKQFIEERDLTILIAVDISGSMSFGSIDWRKCDIAAELTSVFAFSAVQNSDRVGLLLFSNRVRIYIPPRKGREHAQVIVRAAVDAAMRGPSGAADLEQATRFLERVSAKRAVVILLSDFMDGAFEGSLRRLNRKHDLIAIAIGDPREERFPDRGLARVVDAETGDARLIDLRKTDIARRAFQRRQHLERRFRSSGIDWLPVSTAAPYDRDLLRFFRDRVLRRP